MPVILLEKDPFVALDQAFSDEPFTENANVRRPIYGMNIKDPRFAYISLYQDMGEDNPAQVVSLIDSSAPGGYSDANHNFILQSVNESRQEKVQIIETFGDHFAFFYGQKPIILQVQGMLFNSADFNWKNEFLANYERLLRGTKCVENRTRVFLGWDDVVAQGYMLNVQIQYSSTQPLLVPVAFSLLLTKPPLDLSSAADALDNPRVGQAEPYTYRSLEGTSSLGWAPEYLTPIDAHNLVHLDPATGEAQVEYGASEDVPSSMDYRTAAAWISGKSPGARQWKDEEEALLALNVLLTQDQTGADRTSTLLELRENPAYFQLTGRTTATKAVVNSLGSGVTNSASVINDAPTYSKTVGFAGPQGQTFSE